MCQYVVGTTVLSAGTVGPVCTKMRYTCVRSVRGITAVAVLLNALVARVHSAYGTQYPVIATVAITENAIVAASTAVFVVSIISAVIT